MTTWVVFATGVAIRMVPPIVVVTADPAGETADLVRALAAIARLVADLVEQPRTWLVLALLTVVIKPLLGVLSKIMTAFFQCGVSALVVRLAADMYGSTPSERARWRTLWLGDLRRRQLSEQPAYAGSRLWDGVRAVTTRTARTLRTRWGSVHGAAIRLVVWPGRYPGVMRVVAVPRVVTVTLIAVVISLVAAVAVWRDQVPPGSNMYERAVPLLRYQAPSSSDASTLAVPGARPTGWSTQSPLGLGYEPGEERIPGLVSVYRHRCINGCGEEVVYAFSTMSTWSRGHWEPEGEAFRCFDPAAPPPGTHPVRALMNDSHARNWALRGTSDYENAISQGFWDLPTGALCNVWPPDTAPSPPRSDQTPSDQSGAAPRLGWTPDSRSAELCQSTGIKPLIWLDAAAS